MKMKKKNNQLKILANIAKKRLINGDYHEPEKKTLFVPKVSNYFVKNASAMRKLTAKIEYVRINGKINPEFEQKVLEVLDSPQYELYPFAHLIDYNIYSEMTDREKQSYLLEVAEQYNYLKEKYMNKEQEAV